MVWCDYIFIKKEKILIKLEFEEQQKLRMK